MSVVTLADVVAAMERLYPPTTAQPWDQVGLVTGDLDQPVMHLHFAVDPTLAVIAEARQLGTDVLITHHPLLLRGVHSVATTTAKGAGVTSLIVGDVALFVAHTNADVAVRGVSAALADACDLVDVEPLVVENGQPTGRVGTLRAPTSLRDFAVALAGRLPRAPGGLRVSGPAEATVQRIAVLGGAGDSLLDAVRAARVDVYVTADLRHHPALEAREEARGAAPYLIDAGHWATESLWLALAARDLLAELGGDVEATISEICTDPWTFIVS